MNPVSTPSAPRRLRRDRRADEDWRERSGRLHLEYEPAARRMIGHAFRGAFGDAEIEDIYSGAWVGTLRALEQRHTKMSDEEIRKYLLTAVANQAAKELRRRKRKPTAPLELVGGMVDRSGTPDERAIESDSSQVTRDLLMSLPPRRRAVMLLRYGWGLEPSQVCQMVAGLSPRAYRKEVTRGVDELTERMRRFAAGSWCSDREPLLKALAAGVAQKDEERQARAHLAHCRDCSDFVARLNGHLHDLGGALIAPAAIDGIDGELTLGDAAGGLAERVRDAVAQATGRGPAEATQELTTRVAASGGTRGAGAAGAGVLAKLAGLGAAGKAAVACVAGGVAATACVAAGVGPIGGDAKPGPQRHENASLAQPAEEAVPSPGPIETLPSQIESEAPSAAPPPEAPTAPADQGEQPPAPSPPPEPPAEEVVAPSAPPVEQEFGAPAAAAPTSSPAPAPTSSGSGGGGSADPAEQEFAP